ncbi:MAG: hypothetical protein ABIH82_06470, partial [Candidatus Woesearchaeota archaeon]
IEVETSTTSYDITKYVIEGEYTDGITETIGSFNFKVDNSSQSYLTLFSLYDKLNIYMDYGASATTKVFTGMIERISKSDYTIILNGRSSASRVLGKNITYAATDKARSTILSEIISTNFSTILTTTNLESDTGTATVNYTERPFWDIVEEMCGSASFDAYIDSDFDFHYFESGSRQNETDMVVHTNNLIYTGDFTPDLQGVYNKVRVYGAKINDLQIIASATDSSSQTSYDPKELVIYDSSIKTVSQAQARADLELAKNKDPPTVGTVMSLGLPTLVPGEQIRISDPDNGLDPSFYTIQKFTHKFSNDDPLMTELTLQKERISIPTILKKRVKYEFESGESDNPNDLDNCIIINFNTNSGTHSSTEVDSGSDVLKVISGSTTGTWISETFELSEDTSDVELRVSGESLTGTKIRLSTDGGVTYKQIWGVGAYTTFTAGKSIKIQVDFATATASIKSLAFYYNT